MRALLNLLVVFAVALAAAGPACGQGYPSKPIRLVAGSKSPEEFTAFTREDAKAWQQLARDTGAKVG
jgi:tripartite-type tricarboxylate transporter receptor subunit TctC